MKPVSMPVKFYVGADEYEVTDRVFCRNGEVIEEGRMFIFNLLLGQPAWIICVTNEYCPPTYLKTQNVTSVYPDFEVFEGEPHPKKCVFEIQMAVDGKLQTIKVLAVDEIHARGLCLLAKKGKAEIVTISKGDSKHVSL